MDRTITLQRPTVIPWRYWATVASSRSFAFFLSAADGVISYQGFRELEMILFPSAVLAIFIAVAQAIIALTLSSGHNIGENYQARYFADSGVIGGIKRVIGVFGILMLLGFYLTDIWSNFAAFYSGQGLAAAVVAVFAALALSVGDEVLHVLADENAISEGVNRLAFSTATNETVIQKRYQTARKIAALKAAKEQGGQDGQRWSPDGSPRSPGKRKRNRRQDSLPEANA